MEVSRSRESWLPHTPAGGRVRPPTAIRQLHPEGIPMLALEWSALAVLALGQLVRFLTVRCLAHSQERREHQLLQFLAACGGSDAARRPVSEALRALQVVPAAESVRRRRPRSEGRVAGGGSGG